MSLRERPEAKASLADAELSSEAESCGVERQWCGRLGKVDNQVSVFLSCVSAGRAAPLDRRLYLPKKWASDATQRQKCHVPKSLKFAPKWKLALKLIQRSRGVPHGWVTAYTSETTAEPVPCLSRSVNEIRIFRGVFGRCGVR